MYWTTEYIDNDVILILTTAKMNLICSYTPSHKCYVSCLIINVHCYKSTDYLVTISFCCTYTNGS